jgi:hypothetical protein
MAKSPRLSFKGYRFSEALYRNKDAIKAIVAILGGISFATQMDWKIISISLATASTALVVKLLADAVDFYFTEVDV